MDITFSAANTVGLNNPGTEIITLVKDGGGNFINPPSYDKMRAYLRSGEVPMLFVTSEVSETGSLYQLVEYSETENKIRFSNDKTAIEFSAGASAPVVSDVVPKPLTYDYMPEGYPIKTMGTVTVMEEQTLEFDLHEGLYGADLTEVLELIEGQTYTVNWDGTEYECVCVFIEPNYALGNLSIFGVGDDTGEPFIYVKPSPGGGYFGTFNTSANHTISVKTTEEIVTPMTEEFLPSGVTAAIENAQTAAANAQTTAEKNKEVLTGAFSSVARFTFDKQTSGRDTFVFNTFDYYKISDFNPSPSDVISFEGTRESGDNMSLITVGTNCTEYGFFIVVASAGACSIPLGEGVGSFTAPAAGLYARYEKDNIYQTAKTAEFTLLSYGLTIKSSTYGSTKQFKITVDDSGTISAAEVT